MLEKTLKSPLDSKETESVLKEINPNSHWMVKLKLQYFGHLMQGANSLEKTLMLEKLRAGGEGGKKR